MNNVFDNRKAAEAYLKLSGPDFEIMVWTNKKRQQMFSVVRKRSTKRGRRKGFS